MPLGGPRPNAGRNKRTYRINGKEYLGIQAAADGEGVNRKTIYKWCKDSKKPDCYTGDKKPMPAQSPKPELKTDQSDLPDDIKTEAETADMTPLEYMLKIMRDPTVEDKRRDMMANWAAQYMHSKPQAGRGKKEERQDKAKSASRGRFKPSSPPKLKAVR